MRTGPCDPGQTPRFRVVNHSDRAYGGTPATVTTGHELFCVAARKAHGVRKKSGGGGGNRTRVPRHFHAGFYMRSRMIYAFAAKTPNRRGEKAASRQRFLISGVANGDPGRSGIAAGSRTSPAKALSRGNLSLGSHCKTMVCN